MLVVDRGLLAVELVLKTTSSTKVNRSSTSVGQKRRTVSYLHGHAFLHVRLELFDHFMFALVRFQFQLDAGQVAAVARFFYLILKFKINKRVQLRANPISTRTIPAVKASNGLSSISLSFHRPFNIAEFIFFIFITKFM